MIMNPFHFSRDLRHRSRHSRLNVYSGEQMFVSVSPIAKEKNPKQCLYDFTKERKDIECLFASAITPSAVGTVGETGIISVLVCMNRPFCHLNTSTQNSVFKFDSNILTIAKKNKKLVHKKMLNLNRVIFIVIMIL